MIRVDRHILVPAVICMIFAGAGSARAAGFSDGKTLYERNCAVCHGEDGSVSRYGKSLKPFPARNLRAVAQWLDTDEFRRIISYGLHNSKMTAKKYILNPLEIESVIRYIKTFKFSPNLNVGRKRYRQVCAICHGKDGKTRTGMDARNLIYSKLNMKGLVRTIRLGRSGTKMMPGLYQMSSTDIVDIAAYVRSLRYKANRQEGAILFRKNCASCHAVSGRILPAGNTAFQPAIHNLDATQLEMHIRYGRHVHLAGKRVYELTGDDIQNITAYLREQGSEK